MQGLLTLLTGALVASRWLTPTEGAVLGDTLWICQLALLAGVVWAFDCWREGWSAPRLDRLDVGVLLIGAGQALAAAVQWDQADRRAAVNMLWEWAALIVTWFLLRRCAAAPAARRSLAALFLTLCVALAGLGLWQHTVGYAQTRRQVDALRQEWESLHEAGRPADPAAAERWEEKLGRLQAEFVALGIPFDGPQRVMWDQRLAASSEPYGPFALANTFAAVLLVALLLWCGVVAGLLPAATGSRGLQESAAALPRWRVAALLALCGLVAYCLILTKSRTAYLALLVGVGAWLACASRVRDRPARRWLQGLALAGGVGVLVLAAALTGGIDRLVASESLKSLRYRSEYWSGAWNMLLDGDLRWLTGVGPGNFRSWYLQYKLPQSSEEVADPHNLVLDLWSSGGLVAVAGLALVSLGAVRPLWRRIDPPTDVAASRPLDPVEPRPVDKKSRPRSVDGSARPGKAWRDPLLAGGALAFGLAAALSGASEGLFAMLFVGCVLAAAIAAPVLGRELPPACVAAAALALLVHLLGAGGASMPAIVQTLMLLAALGAPRPIPAVAARTGGARWPGLVAVAATLGLFVGCWLTALTPVLNVRTDERLAEQALFDERNFEKAVRALRRAAEADPLAASPCAQLAQLYLQRWLASSDADNDDFQQSVAWQRADIARRPRNFGGYRALGAGYLTRWDRTRDAADARRAADEFSRAVALYPHHAELLSELAEALWRAEDADAAREIAQRSAEQDALNRRLGHLDKLLPESRRALLAEIRDSQPEEQHQE